MHAQLIFVTAALNIIPQALAYVYSTQSLCKTVYATKSPASVKSTSYALTIPLTFTKKYTSTPTVTITPAPVSTTVTTTSTITTVISTAATSTIYTTTTSTTTAFTTSTQTVTTTTTVGGTSTIPTPAGFTPIVSDGNYVPKKRSSPLAVNGRLAKRATTSTYCQMPRPSSPHSFSPPVYPTAVTCGYLVEAITTTTKTVPATATAKTTLVPSTKTGTSTVFTTTTSISTLPGISTTITVSAVPVTTTSTITTSTTTTVTVVAPTATVYAACATNNIVNSANGGHGIDLIMFLTELMSTSDTTPYDCCVSCQTGSACVAYAFVGACYTFNNNDASFCDGSSGGAVEFETDSGTSPSDGYTIGNGPCGQITDTGDEAAG